MGVYYWATWLEKALRSDPVVAPRVIIRPGWETAGRPAEQFSFLPTGVVDHHTACMNKVGHDPQICVNTIMLGNSVAPGPISQLLGTMVKPGTKFDGNNWDPYIVILAAGRANHAGGGTYPAAWGAPEGNGSSIGIEWCGPVEHWPDFVIEFRARVTAAILRHNGWPVTHTCIHNEYAPTRKIDPSGAWKQEPNLTLYAHWNHDKWRQEIAKYVTLAPEPTPTPTPEPTPTPTPPYEEYEMKPKVYRWPGFWNEFLLTSGGWIHGTAKLAAQWHVDFGQAEVLDGHPQGLKACLHQCGLVLLDMAKNTENRDYTDPNKNGGVVIP